MTEGGELLTGVEVLERRFDFFKHMTTVSTAATGAVVAVYGLSKKALRGAAAHWKWADWVPDGVSDWVTLAIPGIAIGGFFLALLLSLRGLYLAAKAENTVESSAEISWVLKWSGVMFILGVGISTAIAVVIIAGPENIAVVLGIFLGLEGLAIWLFEE